MKNKPDLHETDEVIRAGLLAVLICLGAMAYMAVTIIKS